MMNILFFLSPKQDLMYVYDDFTLRQTLEKWRILSEARRQMRKKPMSLKRRSRIPQTVMKMWKKRQML